MTRWYRARSALDFIAKRYLPVLAALNLLWELAQLPLYTIWREASAGYIAFAIAHCTAGDVLIGMLALAFALAVTRASGAPACWRWRTVVFATTAAGLAYTVASEWMNTALRPAWQYSPLMPAISIGDIQIGLSPVAQWLLLPPLALNIARR